VCAFDSQSFALLLLAARSLDVPAAEFSLRQVDPAGNATRVEGYVVLVADVLTKI
jgi:hypothetical protein